MFPYNVKWYLDIIVKLHVYLEQDKAGYEPQIE